MSSIAINFGTTVEEIQRLNNISNPDFIQVGQVIKIEGSAQSNNTNEKPVTSTTSYIVQQGDNLSIIASKFETNVKTLQRLNNISNPDFIQVGQKLTVPGNEEASDNSKDNDNSTNVNGKYVTGDQLNQLGWDWSNIDEDVVNGLNNTLEKFDITTVDRIRHFLSQVSVESAAGASTLEYGSGERYEYNKILGNVNPGDGPKFKGGGYMQLTGRSNYTAFSNYINDPKVISEGATYVSRQYPWISAGYYWYSRGLNNLIDSNPTVKQVAYKVNGGTNGLYERQNYYNKSLDIFTEDSINNNNNVDDNITNSAAWLNKYEITAGYGYYSANINNNMHYGMDFATPSGTAVRAITSGTVLKTQWNPGGGGNTITIEEDDGKHYQWYMHLSSFNVKPNEKIKVGDVIAYSGATGGPAVTGPHLHFQRMVGEISNNAAEDPRAFLESRGLNKI